VKRALFLAALLWCGAAPAFAVTPAEQLHDPKLEARARKIGSELRCVVCQNQTIEDSDAPIASDLRVLLRKRLTAGDTDAQAIAFVVDRYGRFVLMKPPMERDTLILWWGPAVVVGIGALATLAYARSRGRSSEPPPLNAEEQARLAAIVGEDDAA
jgi:cytochrome c-type biogenesis protein CcmH